MKNGIILIVLFISCISTAQEENIQKQLDSIIEEANLMYAYEKVAWNSTDLVMEEPNLRENFGGYLIQHTKDSIFASILDSNQENRIAKYTFTFSDLEKPFGSNFSKSKISSEEKKLGEIRSTLVSQLSNPKYEVYVPEGYSPNLVIIPADDSYRVYILMGTSELNVIPLGNDYYFKTNLQGKIIDWQKFHSRIIPASTNEGNLRSVVHSHLKTTPLITATDICTFRLYGDFYEVNDLTVLSTALNKFMKYSRNTNSIELKENLELD